MKSNEVISRSQFFKKAAKELLADGQPHSYGEIVQYIRTQAKGTCLDGSIESNNVWQSLRSMMQEPESPYQKVKWGTYQKGSPQNLNAKPVMDTRDLQREIYQIVDQTVGLLDRFEEYCSAAQKDIDLADGHEVFIGLSVRIYEGTDSNTLAKGAGHFEDTSIWDGNVALAGHNRGVNNHFGKIHTLELGDEITLTTKLGTRTYEVVSVSKVIETDRSGLAATTENMITLYTCVMNQRDYRWCVKAVEIR